VRAGVGVRGGVRVGVRVRVRIRVRIRVRARAHQAVATLLTTDCLPGRGDSTYY